MIGSTNLTEKSIPKLKISVEGNIASGKSTLLKRLSLIDDIEVLVEPVDKWRNIGGGNLIGRMYQDPKRWGYLFQSNVLLTMMELHHKESISPLCMMERSIFSARYCFVENLHKSGIIDDTEYACYCNWYDYIMKTSPPHIDLIVYIKTSPELCYTRLQSRGRHEESPVQLSYLQCLHEYYESWLGDNNHHSWHGSAPVLVIDGNGDIAIDSTIYSCNTLNVFTKLLSKHTTTFCK